MQTCVWLVREGHALMVPGAHMNIILVKHVWMATVGVLTTLTETTANVWVGI